MPHAKRFFAQVKSEEIKAKMAEAVATEAEISQRSEDYRPVAKRASLLYFCLADLAVVDPMYQVCRCCSERVVLVFEYDL